MLRPARVPPVAAVAALTPRDRAILLALDAYRYLDTRIPLGQAARYVHAAARRSVRSARRPERCSSSSRAYR